MENELILQPQEENRLVALKTSPNEYCRTLKPKKIEDVFLSVEPSIATVIKKLGDTKARAAVVYLLADALEFFNATETMSDTQAAMTVDLIIEEYPYMKLDDIKLCFKNAMKMKYGKIYNRIDGQVIMSWLQEYNKERCTIADNQSWNEHKANISDNSKTLAIGFYYDEYRAELESKVAEDDKDAIKALELSNGISASLLEKRFERQKKDLDEFYKKNEFEKGNNILEHKSS